MENITQIWKKIQSPEFNPATDMALVETVNLSFQRSFHG